jgi:2-hydroxychromene-2-carboxylate isomerase
VERSRRSGEARGVGGASHAPCILRREGPMTIVDWYFDFVSPFAYLQSERLASLAPAISFRYKPVLFAGLLSANGQKGPAEIPAKRAFTYRFCVWQARRLGIALRFPPEHPFNPLPLLRLAIACDCAPDAVHRIFRFIWRDGRLPDLPIEWAELTGELGLADAAARIASPEVKDALRRNTDEALARGVFGVPTIAVGNELFWGLDATQMAAEFVAAGRRFVDPEYARVATLPIGARRDEEGMGETRNLAKPAKKS